MRHRRWNTQKQTIGQDFVCQALLVKLPKGQEGDHWLRDSQQDQFPLHSLGATTEGTHRYPRFKAKKRWARGREKRKEEDKSRGIKIVGIFLKKGVEDGVD